VVVAEIEFGGVAVQVGFADVEIAPIDAALEDRKIVLDRVRAPEVGANVFLAE
jgi:hypothetical protein